MLATGMCFTLGLVYVIPQAYGAGNMKLCGAFMNRMIIVSTFIFAPMLIPIQFIKYLIVAMGQNEDISELASWYIRIISPGMLTYFWGSCLANYSRGCGKP